MSNAQSKRPRRSFATGSAHPSSQADGLRYDGEDVPVLIRLPDLSPQARLREPVAAAAPPVATVIEPAPAPVEQSVEAAPSAAEPAASQEAPTDTATSKPPAEATPGKPTQATAPAPTPGDQPSSITDSESTPETATGSRRRKRSRRKQSEQPGGGETARSASRESRERGRRQTAAPSPASTQANQNILPFAQSKLFIGLALVLVAGLTYFALSGSNDDPADPAGTWAGAPTNTQQPQHLTEPEADLWPVDPEQISSAEATVPSHTAHAHAEPAGTPVWPDAVEPAPAYAPEPTVPADYTQNAPPITAPTNGPSYTGAGMESGGPATGWPAEPMSEGQPTSVSQPVEAWPDAAMTEPNRQDTPYGFAGQTQTADYTTSSSGGYEGEHAYRTGRLEGGPSPGGAINTATNPGSQLNGTIDIPRPRANNEYNGSNVY